MSYNKFEGSGNNAFQQDSQEDFAETTPKAPGLKPVDVIILSSTIIIIFLIFLAFLGLFIALVVLGTSAELRQRKEFYTARKTVLLIGIDSFRHDFLQLYSSQTPNLQKILKNGITAPRLTPVFPTASAPNFFSISTGLYPENHGVVGNNFYDPQLDSYFKVTDTESSKSKWWDGAVPIWTTAEENGLKTACVYWTACDVAFKSVLPTYYEQYKYTATNDERVALTLKQFSYKQAQLQQAPSLVSVYFPSLDAVLHSNSLDSDAAKAAVKDLDTSLGKIFTGLEERGILNLVDIVIVSDHGITPVKEVINIRSSIDLNVVEALELGALTTFRFYNESQDTTPTYDRLVSSLADKGIKVYKKVDIPERLHFKNNRRISDIVLLANEGVVTSEDSHVAAPVNAHGYDNQLESMGGLFIAVGPSVKTGALQQPLDSLNIYPLIASILKVTPNPNAGDQAVVELILKK